MNSGLARGTVLCILAALTAPAAQANESTYTDIDLDACQTLAEDDLGVSLKCGGYRAYPVYFTEGDLRQSVFFGPIRKELMDEGFESFSPFNYIGNKIEWRLDPSGRPFAAILRWYIENPDEATGAPTEKSTGQVLVISRVAQPQDGLGCVVGYVDALANPKANELARAVADTQAMDFACGYSESAWHGERGDKTGEPTRYWPEGLVKE
ncbi:MAG TPA: hypothetical protein DIC56_14170 [Rhizobium sp.]|nr:hypothetical protein [Rhizobium sp.]